VLAFYSRCEFVDFFCAIPTIWGLMKSNKKHICYLTDDFCLVKHARPFSKENMHKNTSSKDFQDASSEFQEFKGGKEFSASFMTGYGVLSFGTLPLASLFWSALLVS